MLFSLDPAFPCSAADFRFRTGTARLLPFAAPRLQWSRIESMPAERRETRAGWRS
jgi:hypothetical protein